MILGEDHKHDSLMVLYRSVILRSVFNIFDVWSIILRCVFNIFDVRRLVVLYVFDIFDVWSVILRLVFNILAPGVSFDDVFVTYSLS